MAHPWVRPHLPFLSAAVTAAVIGGVAWREWWLIVLTITIPLLVYLQPSRWRAALVAASYYATSSLPMIEAHRSFMGDPKPSQIAVLLWMLAVTLLSLPLTLAWSPSRASAIWRIPGALVFGTVPPLGLIGWASPLTAAGAIFPGMAWVGLAAVAILPGVCLTSARPWVAAGLFAGASLLANLNHVQRTPPSDWKAVRTSVRPDQQLEPTREFLTFEAIQRSVTQSKARVLVFPEAIIPRWNAATEDFWEPTQRQLATKGQTALIGAGLTLPGSAGYQNAAVLVGCGGKSAFRQRVPVPLGMWRPFERATGVPLRLTGSGTVEVSGKRTALLICYEQLLVWPILQSATERPTMIVGMANQYWVRNTNIPAAQRACLVAWSRLFAIPLLTAENR